MFFDYQSLGDGYSWSAVFFLTGAKRYQETENFHVLEYLYRYERDGVKESRYIFPFMMLRQSPERRQFSFCWRLYERTTEKGRVSGHFMFIPF